MNKQAAIYVRVSTDEQADKGYSLPSQIEACQKFAEVQELDIAAIYQDDISGVKPIGSRPEGRQLQMAVDSRHVKAVIVYRVDRLSRDIVDLLTTVRDWLRAGVEIYALDIGQVTSELDIVLVIKGWQGSDERKKIIERTSSGRYGKAKAGRAVGSGTPPFGYNYLDGELSIDESQAQLVRIIFDWYVNGDESGNMMSFQKIGYRLTQAGIQTPADAKNWTGKRSQHGVWETMAVRRIILAETYCGVLYYGKNIGANGRGGKRPKEEQIAVIVPAIVSREIWELAQARRAYNSRVAKRRTKREYLLRGLIKCGCGHSMVGTKSRYYCSGRNHTNILENRCKEPSVNGRLLEPITWDYIMNLITDPTLFEQRLRQAQTQEAENVQPIQKELDHVIALIAQTEKEADEIAWAITKTKGLIATRLEQQALEVNNRFQALTYRTVELQTALKLELTDSMINNLMLFRDAVALGLSNPTFEDKRRWLEILQVKVTVTNSMAVISCRLHSDEPLLEKTLPTEELTCRSWL